MAQLPSDHQQSSTEFCFLRKPCEFVKSPCPTANQSPAVWDPDADAPARGAPTFQAAQPQHATTVITEYCPGLSDKDQSCLWIGWPPEPAYLARGKDLMPIGPFCDQVVEGASDCLSVSVPEGSCCQSICGASAQSCSNLYRARPSGVNTCSTTSP